MCHCLLVQVFFELLDELPIHKLKGNILWDKSFHVLDHAVPITIITGTVLPLAGKQLQVGRETTFELFIITETEGSVLDFYLPLGTDGFSKLLCFLVDILLLLGFRFGLKV